MEVICPHCNEKIPLITRPNQKVAGCTHCNGVFRIEVLNPQSNKSNIVPDPNEVKVLCPTCSRKILMPKSMLNTDISCPDCHHNFKAEPKFVIFTISDERVAMGKQLKKPVQVESEPQSSAPVKAEGAAPKKSAPMRPKAPVKAEGAEPKKSTPFKPMAAAPTAAPRPAVKADGAQPTVAKPIKPIKPVSPKSTQTLIPRPEVVNVRPKK